MLSEFNFDIIIILILIGGIVSGAYKGAFRALRSSIIIGVPLISILFLKDTLIELSSNIGILNKISSIAYKILSYIIKMDETTFNVFFICMLFILIIALILKLVLDRIKPSESKMVINEKSKVDRLAGVIIGSVEAYFIIVLCLVLIRPIANFELTTPVTEFIISTNAPLQGILGISLLE